MSNKHNEKIIKEIEAIAAGHKASDVTGGKVDIEGKIPKPKKEKKHKSVQSANRFYGEPAGFWMRLVAYILDYIASYALTFAALYVFGLGGFQEQVVLMTMQAQSDPGNNPEIYNAMMGGAFKVFAISFIVPLIYYTATVGSALQATPAKYLLGMQITTENGGKVGYLRAAARLLCYMISGLILMIGFIMIAFTADKRGLHDYIAGTRVVYR